MGSTIKARIQVHFSFVTFSAYTKQELCLLENLVITTTTLFRVSADVLRAHLSVGVQPVVDLLPSKGKVLGSFPNAAKQTDRQSMSRFQI